MPKLCRSKKDALLEHISSFSENTEAKGPKQETEEMRAEINDNNLSIITQIKEKKKIDEKLSTRVPSSEQKPTNKQMHQTKKLTNQEHNDGIRFRGILELKQIIAIKNTNMISSN